jgi:GntR family transcriptional regulator
MMSEEFHASKPIYLQVADRICYSILRGEIKSGNRLPSVREMAVQMGVNPNTIQRTYTEIERDGIVETRRGQGTFVKNDPALIASLRTRIQTEVIETFVENMKEIGLSKEEMLTAVQQFLKKQEDTE